MSASFPLFRLLFLIVGWLLLASSLSHAGGVRRMKDVAYVTASAPDFDSQRHRLDIYASHRAGGSPRPVVIFIHGGSWSSGDKNFYSFVGRRLARNGAVAVVVSYRLAPAVQVPQMADDCARAVVWTRRHIAAYGGDSTRLFLMGHSAGGGLAALLATGDSLFARYGLAQNPVRGTILDDAAGLDMYTYLRIMASPDDRQYLVPFGTDPAGWRQASPFYHLRAGAPPFLMFAGERTYPAIRLSSVEFQRRAQMAGVPATLTIMPRRRHKAMVLQLYFRRNFIYRELRPFVGLAQ